MLILILEIIPLIGGGKGVPFCWPVFPSGSAQWDCLQSCFVRQASFNQGSDCNYQVQVGGAGMEELLYFHSLNITQSILIYSICYVHLYFSNQRGVLEIHIWPRRNTLQLVFSKYQVVAPDTGGFPPLANKENKHKWIKQHHYQQ